MKKEFVEQIIEKELKMFTNLRANQPAECQNDAASFKDFRSAQFQAWSVGTLESYLHDLELAEADGMNLMMLKYARMEGQIPAIQKNPQVIQMISEMVNIQAQWQKEMIKKYPKFMERSRPLRAKSANSALTLFKTYLFCELETYSQMTLTKLFRDIMLCYSKGLNMSEKIYENMVKKLGYESIADAEELVSSRQKETN